MEVWGRIKRFLQTRNLAFANAYLSQMGMPVWTNWTIYKAVKEGYKINGWVYRAVTLISKAAASVPWEVVNANKEPVDGHHLTTLLQFPNNAISRQDLFELIVSWLELTGNAYLNGVKAGGLTTELWPISPDRIAPIPSKNITEWLAGYALDKNAKKVFEPEEILHFKYFDPANPLQGIGPLQAAAKTVDVDVEQQSWNKSAMQNRGVLDGVFSFKREFPTQKDADDVAEKINERYGGTKNSRRIGVIGSEAKYTRTSATPTELDFMNSRKFNRDEIFIIFGIPPQYAGAQESSTYNNYQTSELVFWFQKEIPLLDDLKDTFNFYFRDELKEGESLTYMLNTVPAIRRALLEKSKTAKTLFEMGVPMSQLNKIFEMGIEEYEGWDISHVKQGGNVTFEPTEGTQEETGDIETTANAYPLQKRNLPQEAEEREKYSVSKADAIAALLEKQKDLVFKVIEAESQSNEKLTWVNAKTILEDSWGDWKALYNDLTLEYALRAARAIVIEARADDDDVSALIDAYLKEEALVLNEVAMIESSTVLQVMDQVEDALDNAWTTSELQQAIIDIGVFSPARALRLSRTIVGTSASMGQFMSAKSVGVTHKRWNTAGDKLVRDRHFEREQQGFVKMSETFLGGARYPLDPILPAGDRCNCRCSMSFEIIKT